MQFFRLKKAEIFNIFLVKEKKLSHIAFNGNLACWIISVFPDFSLKCQYSLTQNSLLIPWKKFC